jgi:release factor glutamine methyltransferase
VRPAEQLNRARSYLGRHGVEDPRADAEILLMHVLRTDRAGLYARTEPLSPAQAREFGLALCRRCEGSPVQYLTGDQPFRGLSLEVRPGVFIPRPETEIVVDTALRLLEPMDRPLVVDVGTGTGAIALSIKALRPDAAVIATDLSPEAVALAEHNSESLGLDIEVLLGDLLSPMPPGQRGSVAMIVSNPPYVTKEEYEDLPEEVRADPYEALVGGIDVYERLLDEATHWLAPGGWLVVEIGSTQGKEVSELFASVLQEVEVAPDLAGRSRIVVGRLR